MKTRLFLIIVSLLHIPASGADLLSVRQMQEDVDYYFRILKEVHPNLYDRYDKTQFDSVQAVITASCNQPMTQKQFSFRIGLANKLTEQHTGVDIIRYSNFKVMEDIRFKDRKLYYKNTEISSIENIPASEIYDYTDGLVTWAYNDHERQCELQMLLPQVLLERYGLNGQNYRAVVKSGDSLKTIEINSTHYDFAWPDYLLKTIPYIDTLYHVDVISTRFIKEESIGILYYNSSDQGSAKKIRKISQDFFKTATRQKIKNIFIDVSMNAGGSGLVDTYILSNLTAVPYTVKGKAYATEKGAEYIASAYTAPCFKENVEEIKNIAKKGMEEFSETHKGNDKGYPGNVFVIMGPQTFSSAYTFCEQIKRGKSGILIGEPSGQRSPFAGTILDFTLPNSGIEFTCGAYSYTSDPIITDSEGFLQPDIPYKLDHLLGADDYKKIIRTTASPN